MSLDAIHAAIPHRPPFLLVDEIVSRDPQRIHCRKTFQEDEYFFAGHYPHFPIVPGVLLCEAAMQAGAILLAQFIPADGSEIPVAARMDEVKFKRIVKPRETVDIEVELTERLARAFYLKAVVKCAGQVAVRFTFVCTTTPK